MVEIISIILLIMIIAILFYLVLSSRKKESDPALIIMQQQIDSLRQQLGESLSSSNTQISQQLSAVTSQVNQQLASITQQVNTQLASITQQLQTTTGQIGSRLDSAARVVGEVKQNLGELSKATERIFEVGKDISSLHEILKPPKMRGVLGEMLLENLLAQVLPSSNFTLQYKFKGGETVDAVITLNEGLVPIDSKFPLENFRRMIDSTSDDEKKRYRKAFASDVKRHIDIIASKYILPDEGTFDFALMYIPAENVYYEIVIKDESLGEEKSLLGYAMDKRVVPVSPNSFYAYLHVIAIGLKGMRIQQSTKEVIALLQRLRGDFDRFYEDFEVMGRHLNNARTKYDEATRRLERFGDKLLSVSEERPLGIEE
ncbi:MAG: DNA recombination protein RmuC [Nitrospirota bacterium]